MKKELIIERLESQIKDVKKFKQGMNKASWGYELGVLISGNEAQFILNILKEAK